MPGSENSTTAGAVKIIVISRISTTGYASCRTSPKIEYDRKFVDLYSLSFGETENLCLGNPSHN